MASVITESSTVKCNHGGTVQLHAGQSKLTVNGNKVMVDGDLAGASILTCSTPVDPNTGSKKCGAVALVIPGSAQKLKVNGKAALLESVQGKTDGNVPGEPPPPGWSVQSAGQTKLKTV